MNWQDETLEHVGNPDYRTTVHILPGARNNNEYNHRAVSRYVYVIVVCILCIFIEQITYLLSG